MKLNIHLSTPLEISVFLVFSPTFVAVLAITVEFLKGSTFFQENFKHESHKLANAPNKKLIYICEISLIDKS